MEMGLPIAFMLILVAIKNAVKNNANFQAQTVEAVLPNITYKALSFQDYVTAMQATRQCVQMIDPSTGQPGFWISGIPEQGYVRYMLMFVRRISVLLTLFVAVTIGRYLSSSVILASVSKTAKMHSTIASMRSSEFRVMMSTTRVAEGGRLPLPRGCTRNTLS
jgi:hypothetical protein